MEKQNPYSTIPLNQPNRDELIKVLEHIRDTEPETYERNVRECCAVVPAPMDETDSVVAEDGVLLYSYRTDHVLLMNDDGIYVACFRIKTRKP